MGHQKAACEIIVKLFDPNSVMQSAIGRMALQWYVRYDVTVALLGAFPVALPDSWFAVAVSYYQQRIKLEPTELRWKIDDRIASMNKISKDMASLYSQFAKQQLSETAAVIEHDKITHQLVEWKDSWDPSLTDTRFAISEPASPRSATIEDIVEPFTTGLIFDFPLLSTTVGMASWHAQMLLHQSQHPTKALDTMEEELTSNAYMICKIFTSLESWQRAPSGVLAMMQPCLSIATLFLPRDTRHTAWLSRRFACLESMG